MSTKRKAPPRVDMEALRRFLAMMQDPNAPYKLYEGTGPAPAFKSEPQLSVLEERKQVGRRRHRDREYGRDVKMPFGHGFATVHPDTAFNPISQLATMMLRRMDREQTRG